MLILFEPWRDVMDLKTIHLTWQEAFQSWRVSANYSPEIDQILNNMNLLNECKDSKDRFEDPLKMFLSGPPGTGKS